MLGHLIASLDEPEVSARLLSALQAPALQTRLAAAVAADGRAPAELVASAVRRFVDTASDDEWLQLVGIMGRATDAEVVCIIRPRDASGKSEVITLDRVSPEFVRALADRAKAAPDTLRR